MLRAFAAGAGQDDTLTLLGDGPLRQSLERLAGSLGLEGRVTFAGHVPDAAGRMSSHDVLLMSSRYEGVPAVLVEALAAGLRVVSTDCGPGVRALLADGLGTIVPIGDATLLGAALAAEPTRPLNRTAARERARGFTLEGAAEQYLAAMRGLMRREQPKRQNHSDPAHLARAVR